MAALLNNVRSRLKIGRTSLFICDIQDRFRPLIYKSELVISNTKLLYDTTRVMVNKYIVPVLYILNCVYRIYTIFI